MSVLIGCVSLAIVALIIVLFARNIAKVAGRYSRFAEFIASGDLRSRGGLDLDDLPRQLEFQELLLSVPADPECHPGIRPAPHALDDPLGVPAQNDVVVHLDDLILWLQSRALRRRVLHQSSLACSA